MGFPRVFFVLLLTVSSVLSAPPRNMSNAELEKTLSNFLDTYYEKYVKNVKFEDLNGQKRKSERKIDSKDDQVEHGNVYDKMQSDQPEENDNNVNVLPTLNNFTGNLSDINILQASRDRAKEIWTQQLKINILRQVGRVNVSSDPSNSPINLTHLFPDSVNGTDPVEDAISKKIRTFYPSCYIPEAAEIEFRNEDKHMNLFFNYSEDQQARKIATATLRLHRVPSDNFGISNSNSKNCTSKSNEQEKRLRVSIYWYIKQQRNKRRGKKRLSDSRVISLNDRYVELDVSSAIYSWKNEGNLGLTIQVEDQDGKTLKTDKYFRGPTCLVGVSTQRPIPTALVDSARTPEQFFRLLGRNTTAPFPSNILLLPSIDVCTVGFPVNATDFDLKNLRTNACNLRTIRDQAQKLLEKDMLERLVTLRAELRPPATTTHRHLRHQRNYNNLEEKIKKSDTQILMTRAQLAELLQSMNLTNFT